MNGHLERPLRLGEIFDRAVTISVRGCLPLFVLFALYDLPMGVLQLFGATRVDHFVGIIVAAVLDRVYEISGIGAQNAGPTTIDNVVLIVGLLLQPLLSGAIAFAVMRGLAGESMQPALAYRAAFARYGQLLGVFAISTASLGIHIRRCLSVRSLGSAPLHARNRCGEPHRLCLGRFPSHRT